MLSASSTSLVLKYYKDRQNIPTWKLNIWERVYQEKLDSYHKLICDKIQYCTKLEERLAVTFDDNEAKKINWQIIQVRKELNTLTGLKIFVEELQAAYLQSSDWLYIATKKIEYKYLEKLNAYKNEIAFKDRAYQTLYSNCMRYKDTLTHIECELKDRAIILNTKIDSSWTK